METENELPEICVDFEVSDRDQNNLYYKNIIGNILKKILPDQFFNCTDHSAKTLKNKKSQIHSLLPLTTYIQPQKTPFDLSFYSLSVYRPNAFKFLFEMISRWLVPGRRLNVVLFYSVDFKLPLFGAERYTLCEVMIRVETQLELDEILHNLPIIQSELFLGITSNYYAKKILEIKGLSNDEKTAIIQEQMAHLIKRRPKDFQSDLFTEMQHFLVTCKDDFKDLRSTRHLSRIVSIFYLFRCFIRKQAKKSPQRHHMYVKIFQVSPKSYQRESFSLKNAVSIQSSQNRSIGIIVGLNFLSEKEIFEQTHLCKAIRTFIPDAIPVKNSFYVNRRGSENICTLYLEIQKESALAFTHDEIRLMRKELPQELENRIEQLIHPVFMPTNEEEIMRNVLNLSNQIKFLRDLPQVFIAFEEQRTQSLFFSIIIARVQKKSTIPIRELFQNADTVLEYIHDRCKRTGLLRKKYPKEATVFRVSISKDNFLRPDHSIDLYKAREFVVKELTNIIGPFRDYNGGIIAKQNETLNKVRNLVKEKGRVNEILLENFFFSIHPVIMRSILDAETLSDLYLMLHNVIEDNASKTNDQNLKVHSAKNFVYAALPVHHQKEENALTKALTTYTILTPRSFATGNVEVNGTPYIAYLYRSENPKNQSDFIQVLKDVLKTSVS